MSFVQKKMTCLYQAKALDLHPACTAPPAIAQNLLTPPPKSMSLMGRKRKRPCMVEPLAERVHRETAGGEVDCEDFVATNPLMAESSAAGEREDAAEDEEDIGELLEPFTRDELRDLLTDAYLRDPALLSRLAARARRARRPEGVLLQVRRDRGGAPRRVHQTGGNRCVKCEKCCVRPPVSLGADRDTGLFRGYAIFFFKTPDGLKKALEEPTKVFDGCELQCRRAYRVTNRKHAAAAPVDTGVQSNGGAVAAVLPSVQAKDLALTSKQSVLSSNQPVGLTAEGSSSAPATVGFRQNVPAGGAGILGAAPVASSLIHGTSSTPPNHCGAAIGHVGLGNTARAGTSTIEPIIGAKNSLGASHPGRLSARPGLIQHYLGR
ncbi:hypothetical protein PVAP13_1KG370700 [Panicum virgatum]|uniref:RRM domain-containing protein n=1 Tax=Panicum virgatum TaxID=38727 RepID=A0A8T0XWB4_PANVG|nr:hypothetical protein PVAP13_1KG370700 [Panicum virgatum]